MKKKQPKVPPIKSGRIPVAVDVATYLRLRHEAKDVRRQSIQLVGSELIAAGLDAIDAAKTTK